MIYILCRSIQSGKTTSLIHWSEKRTDVYGILTPVVNGVRIFMNAHTREQFPMEATGDEESIKVGRFTFSKNYFEKAVQIIRSAIRKEGWLVIDEIGPLELKGGGFHDVFAELIQQRKERIIIVVREGLCESVSREYKIEGTVVKNINEIIRQ